MPDQAQPFTQLIDLSENLSQHIFFHVAQLLGFKSECQPLDDLPEVPAHFIIITEGLVKSDGTQYLLYVPDDVLKCFCRVLPGMYSFANLCKNPEKITIIAMHIYP